MTSATGILACILLFITLTSGQLDFEAATNPTIYGSSIHTASPSRIIIKSADKDRSYGRVSAVSETMGIDVVELKPGENVDDTINALGNLAGVIYAVNDTILWAVGEEEPRQAEEAPNDPNYRFQWNLPRIGAPEAWKALENAQNVEGERNVTVCVTDSGIDANHPDLAANLHPLIGYNAIQKDNDLTDGLKHGTHIAGIVGAATNNGLEVAGVGDDRIQVLMCKFLSRQGFGYTSDAIACIDYCLSMGADIITNSWSGGEQNPALLEAIQHAAKQDVLVVVAAGNTATDLNKDTVYPASYSTEVPNMLVVASTNYKDKLSNFSNYGTDAVQIAAPGEWILSTVPGNDTAYYSGTSMAAPLVAGAAALVLSASDKKLSAVEVKDILLRTVQPLPSLEGKISSGGIVNVARAVNEVLHPERNSSATNTAPPPETEVTAI